ncbi:MAG TPA: tetratricopeptide repeat protein [Longimicrobiaceae bacterium]|nr:tetratricopeptide repeat protein [Longimicrobiaceae bacterium]
MRKPRLSPAVRRTRRRWRVPPAITHGDEAFEGGAVLDEFEGWFGLILWQSVRDVALWSGAPEERRGELFREGAEQRRRATVRAEGLDPRVEAPLLEISEILGHPHALTGELTARACLQVAQWADDRGATATALAFSQSAAFAAPADAATAFTVARLARRRAEYARAESWYRRTVALARQSGDWNAYARSFLGLGTLYMQRGNLPASRRFYLRALRSARRHSLHEVAAMVYHDLFVLSATAGWSEDAERYARGAFEEYGSGHPRLPALCHDVAYFWMKQGYPARALPIFRALLPRIPSAAERVVILANIARAAGAVGDRALFEDAWAQVLEGVERAEAAEGVTEALVELAWGASSLGDWERAEQAASRALEVAAERAEGKIRLAAETALESARERRATGAVPVPGRVSAAREADALAEDLVRSLSQPAASV